MGEDTEVGDDEGEGGGSGASDRIPFAMFVICEAGLAPASLLLGWALGVHPLADFAWDLDAALTGVAAALPMLLMLAVMLRWPVGPLKGVKAFLERELSPVLEGCEWPDLAVISAAAGVGEEMLFRGVVQAAVTRFLGPVGGLAAASLVFGLLHPVSPAYVLIAGLLGGYLGLVWLLSGNLLTAIVAHAVYDFVALIVLLGARETADNEAS